MIQSLFPICDSVLLENSPQQNVGLEAILELSRYSAYSVNNAYNARFLMQFDLTEVSQSISSGLIPTSSIFSLSVTSAEGYEIPLQYTIDVFPVSQSWISGVGRNADNPKDTMGVSWQYLDDSSKATQWITGSLNPNTSGSYDVIPGGGTWYVNYSGSQSFNHECADLNINVTSIVNAWINGHIPNNGFIVKWSEDNSGVENLAQSLKFYGINSHTIFLPKLNVKWDDHTYYTQSFSYSTQTCSSSGEYLDVLQHPIIPLPPQSSNFYYQTGSANFLVVTSSFLGINNVSIEMVDTGTTNLTGCTIDFTGTLDGYISGSFNSNLIQGSGSGFFYEVVDGYKYFSDLTFIGYYNTSGSIAGYYSGSFIGNFVGNMSCSYCGILTYTGSGTLIPETFQTSMPTYNKHYYVSGSQTIYATSSIDLNVLDNTTEIVIYPNNLKSFYKQDEQAIIQINSRYRYPEKYFTTESVYRRNYCLPEESYYCIRDGSSENDMIPFDEFTQLSCGGNYDGNYFPLSMRSLQPERNYRLIVKTTRGNGVEYFDNKFFFKVIR